MRKHLWLLTMLWCSVTVFAQEYFPENHSVKTANNNYTAFTNAKIYVTPTQVINKGTLLIKDGKVVATGSSVAIPKNSVVIDLDGKHIYPSFIEMYSGFSITQPKRQGGGSGPQYDASRQGYYWNDHVMPENKALAKYRYNQKGAEGFLKAGFGVVNTHIQDGIIRGTSVLVALNNVGNDSERILDQNLAQHLSFRKSVTSRQSYPSSIMGSMALLRQFHFDSEWYATGASKTKDLSLEAYNRNKNLPQIIDAGGLLNNLRADKVANDIGMNWIIKGGGDEFKRVKEIKATNASFIIPVNFPNAYDVSDPHQASKVSLGDMRMWNQAPSNPAVLAKNEINFALTTADLKSKTNFKNNVLKAIEYGLDETKALEALTTIPAQLLGKSNEIGSLKKGAYANFLITSGNVFDKKTTLYENWVSGNKYVVTNMDTKDVRGDYNLTVAGQTLKLAITGSLAKPKAQVTQDSTKLATNMTYTNGWVNIFYTPLNENKTEFIRLVAPATTGNLSGNGTLTNGQQITWSAIKQPKENKKETDAKKESKVPDMIPVTFPNIAYGNKTQPKQETTLFKNATVWTSEAEGILQNTDVLVKDGKITKIGKNLSARGAKVIDATGKHLTAGIVDEHSHIAASSINEGGHNSSAEVTIEDAVDSEDINIYRNLSGGVTSIQILHGSANPIGGRSAIIKLKWGEGPEELIYKNSPKFIKFALGENVKQSNWNGNRFPQSRMGVEQVFMDYFNRAKEYDEAKKSGKPYRKDLEMETLAEILNKERYISCHSYVQSEINMLMKVADKFNFNVNTFTHILEGYKVADKMKEHGVGGSTFSDWWAYKYEVNDAIPYNAAIMHNQGITVAINSDDAEMSRRLNQEAAKSVKYGGVSEEEAWKFVTINPAKLLHIDDRVGSIKVGKDADLVLWNNHPMSVYAVAEKTMIEGKVYYDYETMQQKQKEIQEERNMLINKMIQAKNKGMKTQAPKKKEKRLLHCDSL
jgi:imidazolonepropionase-like amidohydrolase